ncbi:hypothetical protein Ciccas_011404 [Cichlidogyrus casuarinus]|uniref:Annexin n=1 Tax=Cichlidogyrus casuarinus TaxID=1844966 RepID=A0ABD2PRR2_9PLAT
MSIGPNGELYNPTLQPSPDLNPQKDAETLYKAMKGLGCDEKKLIEVLGKRTYLQRKEIAIAFKNTYNKDLKSELVSETNGNFGKLVKHSLMSVAEQRALACYHAISGAGTDEAVLIEVLGLATNSEIKEIKTAYQDVLRDKGKNPEKRSLEKDIKDDCGGLFGRVLLAILAAKRDEPTAEMMQAIPKYGIASIIDRRAAIKDAESLYDAGEGKLGTDETKFIKILVRRSVWQLAAIDAAYSELSNKTLEEAIKSEMSGDLARILILLLKCSLDRPGQIAEMLYKSMAGLGTNDSSLMRLILTRCEIDLADIKKVYQTKYRRTLEEDIKGDTSGNYKKMLFALCGSS